MSVTPKRTAHTPGPPMTDLSRSESVPELTTAERAAIRWLVEHEEEAWGDSEYGGITVHSLRMYYQRNGSVKGRRGRSGRNGAATVMYHRLAGKRLIGQRRITDLGRAAGAR